MSRPKRDKSVHGEEVSNLVHKMIPSNILSSEVFYQKYFSMKPKFLNNFLQVKMYNKLNVLCVVRIILCKIE